MKKITPYVIACLFFTSITAQSQVIYGDNFDTTVNTTPGSTSYTTAIVNGALQIVGNGTAGSYATLTYGLHNNGVATSANITSSPKLFIKAKGTGNPSFRIDLKDSQGYVTNLNPSSIALRNTYTVFEINYAGKFTDGAYAGTCQASGRPSCVVNPATISGLELFVNAASGGYNGTIDIEWISFGASLDNSAPPTHTIRYNQLGYLSNKQKLISINSLNSFTPVAYTIKDASNNTVLSGNTLASNYWSDNQEYVAQIDASTLTTPGTYTVSTPQASAVFKIATNPLPALSEASLKYFYYNRASTAITAAHGGEWARASGTPDTNVLVHSSAASPGRLTGTVINGAKGWYDAGDYNKYVVNAGISTYTLLAAYEHNKTYYNTLNLNIPESTNTLPDILDEVAWNLDWMITMQDPGDGGVYHKLTGLNFSGEIMPANYNLQRYVVAKSTAATLNFAAVAAAASRIYAQFPNEKPGYAAVLRAAAIRAYTWAKANPSRYFSNPSGVSTGVYGDNNVTDEFRWAATELFILTGQTLYKNDINVANIGAGTPYWGNSDPLALFSISFHSAALASQIDVTTANNKLITTANQMRSNINNTAMRITPTSYDWGSNGNVANQLMILIRAYEMTNEITYLNAAYTGMDYLLGRNGTGYSYVTGYGDLTPLDPHHRISRADGINAPVPGMLSGGPHSGRQDGCSYDRTTPAGTFSDTWCSYSTNEVTINWNAPLAYAVNALNYYQTLATASVSETINTEKKINLYPNPAHDKIFFNGTVDNDLTYVIYDLSGKNILNGIYKDVNGIAVQSIQSGLYLVEVTSGSEKHALKFYKN